MRNLIPCWSHRGTVLAALAIFCLWPSAPSAPGQAAEKSLYERLGGKPAIVAVVEDFAARQLADDRLNEHYGRTDKAVWKGHLVDLICEATGGPCTYAGRPMKRAHAQLYTPSAVLIL